MDADKACGRNVDSGFVELAVEVFAMLADATRVRIDPGAAGRRTVGQSPRRRRSTSRRPRCRSIWPRCGWPGSSPPARTAPGCSTGWRTSTPRQLVTDAIFQAEHALGRQPRHHHDNGDREPMTGRATASTTTAHEHETHRARARPRRRTTTTICPGHGHDHGHDHGLITSTRRAEGVPPRVCSCRTVTTPPTRSTTRWRPAGQGRPGAEDQPRRARW